LPSQCRERGAAKTAEDVGLAPLALGAAGTELAADELLVALERVQLVLDLAAKVIVRLARRERTATARVAEDERAQRLVGRLEKNVGEATRRHHAECVAVAPRVLGGDETLLVADARTERAALRLEHGDVRFVELARPQVAAQAEQVVQLVDVPGLGPQ